MHKVIILNYYSNYYAPCIMQANADFKCLFAGCMHTSPQPAGKSQTDKKYFACFKIRLPSHSSDDMMNKQIKPVLRKALADTVAGNLKQLIKSGNYKSGDKLPTEPELMQQFGVGRSTIREAVRILSNCGLINVKQGLGTFVNLNEGLDEPLHQRLKRADKGDLREVRKLLEVKAAERAALNRTQKDVARMASLLKKRKIAAQKKQTQACIDFDIEFHIAVAEASGNEILADLYRTVAVQIKNMFVVLLEDTSKFIEKQQLHEDLLQSIIDKDAKKALKHATTITEETVIA